MKPYIVEILQAGESIAEHSVFVEAAGAYAAAQIVAERLEFIAGLEFNVVGTEGERLFKVDDELRIKLVRLAA